MPAPSFNAFGRTHDGRPGGLRTGSPSSPPPPSIRPTRRRLRWSRRLMGPGPLVVAALGRRRCRFVQRSGRYDRPKSVQHLLVALG